MLSGWKVAHKFPALDFGFFCVLDQQPSNQIKTQTTKQQERHQNKENTRQSITLIYINTSINTVNYVTFGQTNESFHLSLRKNLFGAVATLVASPQFNSITINIPSIR